MGLTGPEHAIGVGHLGEPGVLGVQGNAPIWLRDYYSASARVREGKALQGNSSSQSRQPCPWKILQCMQSSSTSANESKSKMVIQTTAVKLTTAFRSVGESQTALAMEYAAHGSCAYSNVVRNALRQVLQFLLNFILKKKHSVDSCTSSRATHRLGQ